MATPEDTQRPAPKSPVRVMISHARTDSTFVDRLQRDLETQGFITWVDRRDIDGAAKWDREVYDREIRNAIDSARVVLVVISPASVKSKWVRQEYTYALQRGKRVILVLHYGNNITPAVIAHLQSIDLRTDFLNFETSFTRQLEALVDSINEGESPEADIRTLSVMISYSHEDRPLVDRLQRDLDGRGFLTWVDHSKIKGGAEWEKEILRAIDSAQFVAVVMSPASVASKWVRQEYTYALRQRKVVVPLVYYPCEVPTELARLQCLDFRPDFSDAEAHYIDQVERLVATIAGYETLMEVDVSPRPLTLLGRLGLVTSNDNRVTIYRKDRGRFLTKVATRYANRLKPYIEGASLVSLGLSEDVQALARPVLDTRDSQDGQLRLLHDGISISEVFQQAGGQLLILGAPGAGKTALLYQLAQDLVGHARLDDANPIPVVFSLASWAKDRKPLERWMADQLVETWQVPLPIARIWVDHREILPLLDGLDEIVMHARTRCVQAINLYHSTHGSDSLVVCSRTEDYYVQGKRLDLQKAVVVQPVASE